MNLQLHNKRILITGSTEGIGKQIAIHFLKEGAEVFINGRNQDKVEETLAMLKEFGERIHGAVGDISEEEGSKAILDALAKNGGVDVLVNNAGIYVNHDDWFYATNEDWMKLYAINVVASVNLIKALVPLMKKKKWGRIIQISSGEATQPFSFMPDYSSTKAAQLNLTVSLSKALSKTGITVNSVSPGLIVTEGLKNYYLEYAKKQSWNTDWKEIEKKVMQTVLDNNTNRLGTPEDVANLVCFIASPLADYINGANLRIDGGSTTSVN